MPGLSARLPNRPVQQQERRLPKRAERARVERVPALRRGGLPARQERIGHNLFRLVQSTVRVLPELRDEPTGRRHRRWARGPCEHDARAAGARLP